MGGFSALQRAENSSIWALPAALVQLAGFSALQRAENSSIDKIGQRILKTVLVSVLFSEPKIPQYTVSDDAGVNVCGVSVLFSEPKIPQFEMSAGERMEIFLVSVLFSEPKIPQSSAQCRISAANPVSVLFSEPKIPQFSHDSCNSAALTSPGPMSAAAAQDAQRLR